MSQLLRAGAAIAGLAAALLLASAAHAAIPPAPASCYSPDLVAWEQQHGMTPFPDLCFVDGPPGQTAVWRPAPIWGPPVLGSMGGYYAWWSWAYFPDTRQFQWLFVPCATNETCDSPVLSAYP